MNLLIVILPLALSIIMVTYMLPKIMLTSLEKKLIDSVNNRKVHKSVASRLGGIAFFPAIFLSVYFSIIILTLAKNSHLNINIPLSIGLELCAICILYIIGIADDVRGIRYLKKFIFQIVAAILIILSGTYIKTLNGVFGVYEITSLVGIPLTIFLIVFITNAINLIDGIDGLSSLLSILALSVYGVVLFWAGTRINTLLAFATLGALISFCYFNVFGIRKRSNSKIFMGDTGTLVIGAILAILAIKIWNFSLIQATDHFLVSYTMLIIPAFDVIRVILHRMKNHKPLFLPDRCHFHHKLLDIGFTQHQALIFIVGVSMLFFIVNTFIIRHLDINIVIITDIIIWVVIHYIIKKLSRTKYLKNKIK